jgi:hypothetical protein
MSVGPSPSSSKFGCPPIGYGPASRGWPRAFCKANKGLDLTSSVKAGLPAGAKFAGHGSGPCFSMKPAVTKIRRNLLQAADYLETWKPMNQRGRSSAELITAVSRRLTNWS